MKDEARYFDISGARVDSEENAYSKVICNPHNFKHFVKKPRVFGSGFKWMHHHTSTTLGSWMWPDGMPLRGDGVDNEKFAREHAKRIGSNWDFRPSV